MLDVSSYIGKKFGEYRLEKFLGGGSYGKVFLASQANTGRFAAIKLLANSPDKFLNEVRFLLSLRHEYVLSILGFDLSDQYIVMEYAAGGSLQDRLKSRIPMTKALEIIRQIGLALYYSHKQFIVHRDLKPANILFNAKDEALLADVGIAMVLEKGETARVNLIEGSYPYMAPEQFDGEVSIRSDQYALACIAYELLTGRKPIDIGNPSNVDEVAKMHMWRHAHLHFVPKPPRLYNTDLQERREAAILKALAKDRKDRFKDIYEFLTDMMLIETGPLPESDIVYAAARFKNEGLAYYKSKSYEKALKSYDDSLQLDPTNADTYYFKGQVLHELKRNIEALQAFNKAREIAPDKDIFYNCMGNVLCDMDNFEDALEVYKEAIRLAPSKEIYHIGRGNALAGMKDYKGALYAYEAAIRYSTNNFIAARAFACKAQMLLRLSKYQEAIQVLEIAIARNSSDVSLYIAKGHAHWKNRQNQEARRTYEQGLKVDPGNEELLQKLRNLH